MKVISYTTKKINTYDYKKIPNGYLLPIYNENEDRIKAEQKPCQVYLTCVAPHSIKGPHLHKVRWGLFCCIKGNIKIVIKTPHGYEDHFSGEDHEHRVIQVPAGWAAALVNDSNYEALILNMPSPAWTLKNQDDHPVSFQDYRF